MQIIDLDTADGIIEHCKTLPSENLRNIAARPLYVGCDARWQTAADAILALRGE